MTDARSQVYSFINRRGDDMARYGSPAPYQKMIEADSDAALFLHGLLNRVEDARVHAEAVKLLDMHMDVLLKHGPEVAQGLALAIVAIDPYAEHDGQLVRKSDGTPVVL